MGHAPLTFDVGMLRATASRDHSHETSSTCDTFSPSIFRGSTGHLTRSSTKPSLSMWRCWARVQNSWRKLESRSREGQATNQLGDHGIGPLAVSSNTHTGFPCGSGSISLGLLSGRVAAALLRFALLRSIHACFCEERHDCRGGVAGKIERVSAQSRVSNLMRGLALARA